MLRSASSIPAAVEWVSVPSKGGEFQGEGRCKKARKRALHEILYPPKLACRRIELFEKTYAFPFPPINTSLRFLYSWSGVCCLEDADPGPTVV